jgi:hypothetical protein
MRRQSDEPFIQCLDGLDLTIEKATPRTPDRRQFHVFYDGQLVGSFGTLAAARLAFLKLRDESGWTPPSRRELTAEERLEREMRARDRLTYLDYWASSHKFRGGGRPKRRQR